MTSGANSAYVDADGNQFTAHSPHASVTLYGSHFGNALLVATLVATAIWLAAFIILFIAFCKIRRHAGKDSLLGLFLKAKIMGLSTLSMLLYFAIDFSDRIVHELELKTSQWYLLISVPKSLLLATANTTLLGFLLWYLLPFLLKLTDRPEKMVKYICKSIVLFIGLCDYASTIYSRINYITTTIIPMFDHEKISNKVTVYSHTPDGAKIYNGYTWIGGVSDATFNGLYLLCAVIFAVFAYQTLKRIPDHYPSVTSFHFNLSMLAVAFLARCALTLAWSIIFSVIAIFTNNITDGYPAKLALAVLYGFTSVIIYYSILRLVICINCMTTAAPEPTTVILLVLQNTTEQTRRTNHCHTPHLPVSKLPCSSEA